jgi:hypothetical protein
MFWVLACRHGYRTDLPVPRKGKLSGWLIVDSGTGCLPKGHAGIGSFKGDRGKMKWTPSVPGRGVLCSIVITFRILLRIQIFWGMMEEKTGGGITVGVYEAVKDAISIAQKADNLDLMRQLLDLQKEIQDMQQENFELHKKIDELENYISREKKIKYNANRTACYIVDEGEMEGGPYCTHCWEADTKLISLHSLQSGYHLCPHCKITVLSSSL